MSDVGKLLFWTGILIFSVVRIFWSHMQALELYISILGTQRLHALPTGSTWLPLTPMNGVNIANDHLALLNVFQNLHSGLGSRGMQRWRRLVVKHYDRAHFIVVVVVGGLSCHGLCLFNARVSASNGSFRKVCHRLLQAWSLTLQIIRRAFALVWDHTRPFRICKTWKLDVLNPDFGIDTVVDGKSWLFIVWVFILGFVIF